MNKTIKKSPLLLITLLLGLSLTSCHDDDDDADDDKIFDEEELYDGDEGKE